MKITELRVGNWINLHKNVLYEPYQISSGFDLYKLDESDCSDASPIELNEDILVKCGFVKGVDNVFFLKTNLFYIRIFEEIGHVLFSLDKYSNSLKVSDSTKHLHQLQNLYFALTNEELNINL